VLSHPAAVAAKTLQRRRWLEYIDARRDENGSLVERGFSPLARGSPFTLG
jgi:hypothetical protein